MTGLIDRRFVTVAAPGTIYCELPRRPITRLIPLTVARSRVTDETVPRSTFNAIVRQINYRYTVKQITRTLFVRSPKRAIFRLYRERPNGIPFHTRQLHYTPVNANIRHGTAVRLYDEIYARCSYPNFPRTWRGSKSTAGTKGRTFSAVARTPGVKGKTESRLQARTHLYAVIGRERGSRGRV